jgi:hypothetical protein
MHAIGSSNTSDAAVQAIDLITPNCMARRRCVPEGVFASREPSLHNRTSNDLSTTHTFCKESRQNSTIAVLESNVMRHDVFTSF